MRDALNGTCDRAADRHRYWRTFWRGRSETDADDFAGLAWCHDYELDPAAAAQARIDLADHMNKQLLMREHFNLPGRWGPTELFEVESPTNEQGR